MQKFIHPGRELSDPEQSLITAWGDFTIESVKHRSEISDINYDTLFAKLISEGAAIAIEQVDTAEELLNIPPVNPDEDRPVVNYVLQFEQRLSEELPEVAAAAQGLKRALDELVGWHVDWQQYAGKDETYPMAGYLSEATVGPDDIMPTGLHATVRISAEPQKYGNLLFNFAEMLEIRFSPPMA